jgi:hypothetical protein
VLLVALEQQHTDAHELLVTLLHYVPEPDRTRALSQLTTGELLRPPRCSPGLLELLLRSVGNIASARGTNRS